MSVVVKRSALSEKQVHFIREMLVLQPKEKFHAYGKRKAKNVKPVVFYQRFSSPNPEEMEEIYVFLPYRFAAALLGENISEQGNYTPSIFHFTGTLRGYQEEDLPILVQHLDEYGTTSLCWDPSLGKTIMGAFLAAKYSLLTVVLMHRTCLIKQWRKTFAKVTDATVWVVGEKKVPELFNVIICLDKRVKKIPVDIRDRVGMLIIDEAHAFCTTSQVERLLGFHPRYIIAESATLKRDDEMHHMIYAMCGNHNVTRELKKTFHVYKVETYIPGVRIPRTDGGKGVQWHPLAKSLAFNDDRNNIIVELALKNPTYKIVILTGYTAHTKLLHKIFEGLKESVDYLCGPKNNYHDSRILVGTISKIGTGFDEESFCDDYGGIKINLGILAHSIASKNVLEQSVGRVFRAEFPNIMHLVDDDPTIDKHWKTAKRWYKSKGGILHETAQ